ncbi:MAG TPA: NUDIX hydrolase [Pyrinomonadaceae bacterium]
MKTLLPFVVPQAAAVPLRTTAAGRVEVLLVTSRKGRRWIVPKGMTWFFGDPPATARREAYEEAGVEGEVAGGAVGSYEYRKRGVAYRVTVYLLRVTREYDDWPERKLRRRRWASRRDARRLVRPKEMRALIDEAIARLRETA